MIVIGIDPGTRRVGYGLVEKTGSRLRLIDAGLLRITATTDVAALQEIQKHLQALILQHAPERLAIEKLYFAQNRTTGIGVAQARGVILLTAALAGLTIGEYSPNEVKAGVAGYGLANKAAVLKMVRLILQEPRLDVIDDASDALALAIFGAQTHIQEPD